VQYGLNMFVTDFSVRPDTVARLAEERGFESLFLAEHTHIPVKRQSPFPLGGALPERYWHAYDPFVALTAAAVATTRLRLGTGVCLLVERDPITTAKEVASLDRLSDGRFIFGIGGGWNAEEMANHGTAYRQRWRVLRERVLAMQAIWTQDEPEFHGRYVRFDKLWSYPKPLQQPHPPILMGGYGPTTFDRVLEYCDGWIPGQRDVRTGPLAESGRDDPSVLTAKVRELRARAEASGRPPASISVTVHAAWPERANLDALEAGGVDRVLLAVPSEGAAAVEKRLDELARLIR
jgi:probable F420-dependent oxidoreductase